MNKVPGKLIPIRFAHIRHYASNPVVFGFPLGETNEEILANMPSLPEYSGEGDGLDDEFRVERHWLAHFAHLETLCSSVWPKEKIQTKLVRSSIGDGMLALALVASTKPNAELIPQGEVLQKLVDIMVKQGFTKEPKWFYLYVTH